MKYIYRVVLSVSYIELHFDFDNPSSAIDFCATALEKMTDRKDSKNCSMVVKKINLEEENKESEEE